MSVDANALERETLERKDRDELAKIAEALGGKVTSRTRKADIVDQILELTGVTSAAPANDAAAPAASETPKAETQKAGGQKAGDQKTGAPKTGTQRGQDSNDSKGPASKGPASKDQASKGQASKDQVSKGSEPKRQDSLDASKAPAAKDGGSADKDTSDGDDAKSGDDSSGDDGNENGQRRRRRGRNRGGNAQDEFTGEPMPVQGCLDLRDDGYGFLRVETMLPSKDDCYVSVKQVRQFDLRKGDIIAGGARPAFRNEKNPAIVRIDSVNGAEPHADEERPRFAELAATFATEPLTLANDELESADLVAARAIDLLAPIGKGSRVLLAAPPRTGKTSILQALARSLEAGEPDIDLIVVLLDERPEEITEMSRIVAGGTVHGSAFDASPDEHVAVLDLALARAERIAETGGNVVVLMDGLTRLARADHASGQSSGRTIGGIDANAVQAAKRAFGSGRNLENAGSVTVVATATIDTGSAIDEAVFEAVAGAATTQITMDRSAAERRSFPAIDVGRTGTRREELLVDDEGTAQRDALRRRLAGLPDPESADHADGLDHLLGNLRETKSNDEILGSVD